MKKESDRKREGREGETIAELPATVSQCGGGWSVYKEEERTNQTQPQKRRKE